MTLALLLLAAGGAGGSAELDRAKSVGGLDGLGAAGDALDGVLELGVSGRELDGSVVWVAGGEDCGDDGVHGSSEAGLGVSLGGDLEAGFAVSLGETDAGLGLEAEEKKREMRS